MGTVPLERERREINAGICVGATILSL